MGMAISKGRDNGGHYIKKTERKKTIRSNFFKRTFFRATLREQKRKLSWQN